MSGGTGDVQAEPGRVVVLAVLASWVLSLIVPLAVFLVFQKYFTQGVLAGSTK